MTLMLDTPQAALLDRWQGPEVGAAVAGLLGETPASISLDRLHFPGRRPVQANLTARLAQGQQIALLAEYCPDAPLEKAAQIMASLRKSRNGQKAGLSRDVVAVAEPAGLVLRLPGFDERLPGLRLLHDRDFARSTVTAIIGRDTGPVDVALVAHRLGKRAVLRISAADGTYYARLRAIKSTEGDTRFGRHRALWSELGSSGGLRIPEPLGGVADLGISLFAVLPGRVPDFGPQDSRAIGQALGDLQARDLADLPVHSGADEAALLESWLDRCRCWRPRMAARIAPVLRLTQAQLRESTSAAAVPCHRDLHEKQILIAGGRAGLLDFDTICLSDPALDPGNLLAHLFFAGVDEAPLRAVIDRPGLPLWRRAALLRLAMIYAVTATPDAVLDRLVTEAGRDVEH